MSFLNKTYTLDKDENSKEFLESLGLSGDQLKEQLNFKPSDTLKKEGDQYILSITTPGDGSSDLKFKPGVELDEEVAPGVFAKSKFTIGDNIVVQSQSFEDGLILNTRREYSGDELVLIITSNKWDGTARRYFKAA